MESPSIPSSGIFSLHVLIILGVTVALVSAVAVILYNKIQQQGEKLSAVMELSTVLAQELRSHDTILKHIQTQSMSFNRNSPVSPENVVFVKPKESDDIERICVSDGSGDSEDEYSINAIDETPNNIQPITLDNILMNPMCFGSGSKNLDEIIIGDENSVDESSENESNTEEDDGDSISCDVLSNFSETIEDLNLHEDEPMNNDSSENRTITLTEVSVNCCDGDGDSDDDDDNDDASQSNIHKVAMDVEDTIDYKKITVNELRRIAIERQLLDKGKGTKLKKTELIDLLTSA